MNITLSTAESRAYQLLSEAISSHHDGTVSDLCDKVGYIKERPITIRLIDKSLSLAKANSQYNQESLKKIQTCFFNHFEQNFAGATLIEQMAIAGKKGQLFDFLCFHIHSDNAGLVIRNMENIEWERIALRDRFRLLKMLVPEGANCPLAMADHYMKIGLHEMELSNRLELSESLAAKGEFTALIFAGKLARLMLQGSKQADRLKLCKIIAAEDECSAIQLAIHLEKFDLQNLNRDECIAVCEIYMSKGDKATSHLVPYIDKIGIRNFEQSVRIEICKKIISMGCMSAENLINYWEKFGLTNLSVETFQNLFKQIASVSSDAASRLAINFQNFDFSNVTREEKLTLYETIGSNCRLEDHVTYALEHNFYKLFSISPELPERLNLCRFLASWSGAIARAMITCFSKFKLQEASIADRLQLCELTARWGDDEAAAVAKYMGETDLHEVEVTDRLKLFEIILSKGISAAVCFTNRIDKSYLRGVELVDRLRLCYTILQNGKLAAITLARNITKFSLKEADLARRLELFDAIFVHGEEAASAIASNLKEFSLGGLKAEERLKLYSKIAEQGEIAAMSLGQHIGDLKLQDTTLAERLTLYMLMISQGEEAARSLIWKFNLLDLADASAADRFNLCKSIATRGPLSAVAIASNFEELDLLGAPLADRLDLCEIIVSHSDFSARQLVKNFDKFCLHDTDPEALVNLCEKILSYGLANINIVLKNDFFCTLLRTRSLVDRFTVAQVINTHSPAHLASYYEKLGLSVEDIEEILITHPSFITDSLAWDRLKNNHSICRQALVEFIATQTDQEGFNGIFQGVLASILINKGYVTREEAVKANNYLASKPFPSPLCKLFEKAQDHADQQARAILTTWTAYAAETILDLDSEQVQSINDSGLFELIYNFNSPSERYPLMRNLSFMAKSNPSDLKGLKSTYKSWTKLSAVLLSRFTRWGMTTEQKNSLLTAIDLQKGFKDTQKARILFQFLLSLISYEPYTVRQVDIMTRVISKALEINKREDCARQHKNVDTATNTLSWFSSVLLIFGKNEFLSNFQDPEIFFREKFSKLFGIKDSQQTSTQFENTFGKFRNRSAIFTYLAKINHLPEQERRLVNAALSRYVQGVLDGTFPSIRYLTEDNPHLHQIFDWNKNLKEAWTETTCLSGDQEIISLMKGRQEYTIFEDDDACNLLLIGTEINGSCLKVDGDPKNSKCLTGCLLNGDTRPIMIKGPGGKIVARSFLRLMWDGINNTPVLLLERIYSNDIGDLFKNAISAWAIKRAEQLKLLLVSKDVGIGEPYQGKVEFLGGSAPYVYCDAAKGVFEGPYIVEGCHLLKKDG